MKACRSCRYVFESGNECPLCKSKDVTDKFYGEIIIFDVECEIAKAIGAKMPGTYAVRLK